MMEDTGIRRRTAGNLFSFFFLGDFLVPQGTGGVRNFVFGLLFFSWICHLRAPYCQPAPNSNTGNWRVKANFLTE